MAAEKADSSRALFKGKACIRGAEPMALSALKDQLRAATAIHTEVSTRNTYASVSLYGELRSWLEGEGFRVECEAIPQGWDMGNVLFAR